MESRAGFVRQLNFLSTFLLHPYRHFVIYSPGSFVSSIGWFREEMIAEKYVHYFSLKPMRYNHSGCEVIHTQHINVSHAGHSRSFKCVLIMRHCPE